MPPRKRNSKKAQELFSEYKEKKNQGNCQLQELERQGSEIIV